MEEASREAQGSRPSPAYPTDRVLQPCAVSTASQCHPPLRVWDPCLPAPLCSHCEYACPRHDHWSLTPDWSDLGPCLSLEPLPSELSFPQDAEAFTLPTSFEEGKEKCPYDPARGFTGLIIGEHALLPTPPSSTCMLCDGHGCHC